jgi:uncharacterized protein
MRIAIFGITGFTGGNLMREALARGHEVVGSARRVVGVEVPDGVTLVGGDVQDETAVRSIAGDADAIVVATPALGAERNLNLALPGLLGAARDAGARLGVVGGSSSLKRTPDGPRVFDDGFPEEWRDEARAHIDVLDTLLSSETDVDWFYLSPALQYGAHAPGERLGAYRTGGNVVVEDGSGTSYISGADLAIAVLDELERPQHRRERFTVAY